MAINDRTIGLALSGGGYRATLFGLGSLWRLNDAGLLGKLDRITSVSGGSILSALLAKEWTKLNFAAGRAENFVELVADPIQRFCGTTIDIGAGLKGMLNPLKTAGDYLAEKYRDGLLGDTMLKQIPAATPGLAPKFIFYATNMQTGRSFRFRQDMVADYYLGVCRKLDIPLATAVAASSAFPPIFSPVVLKTNPSDWEAPFRALEGLDELRKRIVLADGGVYDNMGLESLADNVDIVLVSDAGAPFQIEANPPEDELLQLGRVRDILIDQTRALRKYWLCSDFSAGRKRGAYWGIATQISDYRAADTLTGDNGLTQALRSIPTRLCSFEKEIQGQLINWGYALADAALRTRAKLDLAPATAWPKPDWPLAALRAVALTHAKPPPLRSRATIASAPKAAPRRIELPGGLTECAEALGRRDITDLMAPVAPTLAEPACDRAAPAEEPSPKRESRFIQHRLFRKAGGTFVEEQSRLEIGSLVRLWVFIGPPDHEWQITPEEFPDHLLPKNRDGNTLQIMFHEPEQMEKPLLREILLPAKGPSNVAEFEFALRKAAPFSGRITVLYRGRILQTAIVKAVVCEPGEPQNDSQRITRHLEATVRPSLSGLDSRRPFDLAVVLNHTDGGRPMLTAVSKNNAWAKNLTGIDAQLLDLNQTLSQVALDASNYGKGLFEPCTASLLVTLANIGAQLYSQLFLDYFESTKQGLDVKRESRIQIVSTRADAVVPLEFIYPFSPPDDDAKVCPHAEKALKGEPCPSRCLCVDNPSGFVCPLGFWGLSKVIERHVFNPNLSLPESAEVVVQAEPIEGRDTLALDRGVVLGYSQEVDKRTIAPLKALLQTRFSENMRVAVSWDQWRASVNDIKPTLLVAFPHNQGAGPNAELEIQNDLLKTLKLPTQADYVHIGGSSFPLVLLLGCDVAGTAQEYGSHIRYFRQAGAAVVISTIATVFGKHAVAVGEKLLQRLLDPARPKNCCLGELLRDVKREAVAESLPMALCVVAFGDADWRL